VTSIPALFISPLNALKEGGGGVQVCTREYRNVLTEAGFDIKIVSLDLSLSPIQRVQRRLFPRIGEREARLQVSKTILRAIEEHKPAFIFYNFNVFVNVLMGVRDAFPLIPQVLLSLGLESTDFRISQQINRQSSSENRIRGRAERMLNRHLTEEREQRALLDAVITLSPLEVELEKSLGARRVTWLPGTVTGLPLDHKPVEGRVGCVSTLDHPPNWDGLVRLCHALVSRRPPELRLRLVGQPAPKGYALSQRYSFVEYLGPLEDAPLRDEASTWCCFVHPLFVTAKGRSTKLGVALGWGIPIATTEVGVRGYDWVKEKLPLFETPEELAKATIERSKLESFGLYRDQTIAIVRQTPSLEVTAAKVSEFLSGLVV